MRRMWSGISGGAGKNDVDASWLLPRPSPVDEDEFQQELEPPETEEDEDNEPMADPGKDCHDC